MATRDYDFDMSKSWSPSLASAGAIPVGLLALFLALPTRADTGPLITDRPDFTESAATVAEGRFQLEGGVTAERTEDETVWTAGELLLRVGLAERLELRVSAPSHVSGPGPDGFADGGVGAKVLLIPEARGFRPATAVIVATSVPSGEAPFRSASWQPETKLCLAWDVADGIGLAANLNYARPAEDGRRFDEISGSLSVAVELAPQWGAYLEWFGFSREAPGGDATNYLNTGVTYLVHDDFQLDARIGAGLGGDTADFFAGLGAAVRF